MQAYVAEKQDKPLLIKFSAPWCPPCQRIKPAYESMAEEHADVAYFAEIDMDDFKEVVKDDDASFKQWAPNGIPQIWLLYNKDQKVTLEDVSECARYDSLDHVKGCLLWSIEEARKIASAPKQTLKPQVVEIQQLKKQILLPKRTFTQEELTPKARRSALKPKDAPKKAGVTWAEQLTESREPEEK